MITGRLNLIIFSLIAVVAILSIGYNFKLTYDMQVNQSSRMAYELAHQSLASSTGETSQARTEQVTNQLKVLQLPVFVRLEEGGAEAIQGGPIALPETVRSTLDLRGVPQQFDQQGWIVHARPLGDGQMLLYGFERSAIWDKVQPVLLKTILFVAASLAIYLAVIFFYVRSRLEEPLEKLLKKRMHALVAMITSGSDDESLREPIAHLPKPLSQSVESIFSVLLDWSRYKRHFEEFMALSVSETDKSALCRNFHQAIKEDFFVRSLLVLEANHSANRLEAIYSSDAGFEVPDALLSDPAECLVYRTGSKVIQSRDRSFCDLCGTLEADEAVLCKPLIAGAVQQGICRMVIDRRALEADMAVAEGLEKKMQFVEAHLKSYLDFVALSIAGISLQNAYRNQALTDELTSLYNRRYIVEYFENMLNIAKRKENPITVMMIDIDNFKRFNDEYGHKVGDKVLQLVSKALEENVREGDAVGRYGGEEFIVIFPHTEIGDAHQVAERIREAVASMQWDDYGLGALPRITISAGLAWFPRHGYSHYHLTNAADRALYQAKRAGKNRVMIHCELKERTED